MPQRRWFLPRTAPAVMLAGAALVAPALHAQYENGSIVGSIKDPSGAPIAHAAVQIANVATGVVVTAESGDAGQYDAPQLRVGVYTVTAKAPGFSNAVAKNITVSVGNRQRIDLSLPVGTAETSVEVSDVALQLETEQTQRDQTITHAQTEALPLVNRNYEDLLGLVTGVRQAPSAATTSSNLNALVRQGAYNVNGQRSVFNNFLLDGMDNNSYGESNQGFDNQIIDIPPDSVAQFSVVTNNEGAEYGRSSGATINVASQSGGNQFHFVLYDFLRNTDLNAAGFFKPNTLVGTGGVVPFRKPTTNRNQFGGNFGGPLLRNKLFFFLDYEGLRSITKPLYVLTLPTQNELNGILVVPVRNPLTGVTYAANTAIPTSAFNPLSLQIVNAFKQNVSGLPVSGLTNTGLASSDYSEQVPFRDFSDKGDLRLDYTPNATSTFFLRVSDRKETGINFALIPLPLEGQSSGTQRILDQQVALGYTGTFGSNRVLDLRLGVSKTKAGKTPLSVGAPSFGIPGLPTAANLAGGLPAVSITGFTAFGRQTTNPQFQNPSLVDPKVNYTWVKGNHSLKFGYEWEKVWMGVLDNGPLYGSLAFGGGFSTPTTTTAKVADNYWADFLFGTTSTYSLGNYFEAHLRQNIQSAYAQDDWRVTPNLTLSLGLRWEYGSPYSEQNHYVSNFDPITQTVLTLSPGAVAGNGITPTSGTGVYGRTLQDPDLDDFAPRFGFAYSLTPTVVFRGGFGTSYVHYNRAGSGNILPINAPQAQFAAVTQIAPTTANHCSSPVPAQIIPTGSTTETCYVTADQGFPAALATSFNPATDNVTWSPRHNRDSYVESYYVAVQKQLRKNTLLDIAYVGNHGLKLLQFLNGNQRSITATGGYTRPFGNWPSDITEALNEAYSNYSSLQVRYEQRMSGGLTLLNSFTWEHSLDNASSSLEGNTPSPQNATNLRAEYAQSDYNLPVANVTSLVYDLPYGRGRRFGSGANPLLSAVAGGWQLSAINTAQAGTPFNLTYSPNSTQLASTQITASYRGVNLYRPNRVAGVPLTQGRSVVPQANTGYLQYINYNALQLPSIRNAAGVLLSPFGNLGRNAGRTPELNQLDLDANKQFALPGDRLKLEFRSELYNILNHTNLYLPSTVSGTQGSAPNGGGLITSTFTPRVVQFALKLIY